MEQGRNTDPLLLAGGNFVFSKITALKASVLWAVVVVKAAKLNRGCRMAKCVICSKRPAKVAAYCIQCNGHIEADHNRKRRPEPRHFLTYRGHVVGLFKNGEGMLKAQLLRRNPDRLPKSKTFDLNRWVDGFSRAQIKDFKACVLKLAHA